MLALLHIASLAVLAGLILSDFRRREIGTPGLILSAVLNTALGGLLCGWPALGLRVAVNLVFLAMLYLALWGYVAGIRRRAYRSLFQAVGAGDLLFLPVLSPLFEPREFVLFLTAAFFLSLAGWSVYRLIFRRRTTIPLVGTVGLCFLVCSFFLVRS
jgi:hypothetical protein